MNGENNNGGKKKKRFDLFGWMYGRDGRGVKKSDVIKDYNLKNYFKLFGRRFRNIVTVNLLYIIGNFPILFFILATSGNFSNVTTTPASELYSVIYGISTAGSGFPTMLPALGIHGISTSFYADTVITYILYGLSALVIITFGLVNCGCAYIMRNIVKGEPLFLWQDFFGTIKRNWKQALPMGIFDAVFIGANAFAVYSYWINYNNYYVLFFCSLVTFALYFFMRYYMYMIMVTFEMGFFKILKNSFILAILCIGKNFLALFGILIFAFLTMLFAAYYTPLGIIILLVFLFGASSFTATYVAYPNMKKYMIDPFYPNGEDSSDEDESLSGTSKSSGYGDDDGEYYDAGEYVTDEDELKGRKKT
ncbi:MAG: hypothetical protein ACI4QR_06930 [Eubacteriales bacterium]